MLVLAPLPNDNLAREQAVLVEHGYDVVVVTADPFFESIVDLMNPRFVTTAAAVGAKQAEAVTAELTG